MAFVDIELSDSYWQSLEISQQDIEYLYTFLLEKETPLPSTDLASALISERIRIEKKHLKEKQQKNGDIYLPERMYEVGIPVVVRKSMGPEKQKFIVNLVIDGKLAASNQIYIGGGVCSVNENLKIALIPGTDGLLEDILGMTGAYYQTISERYLETGNLDFFDLIIFDTDCLENYRPSSISADKIRNYMEYGGGVLVFGQPDNWRDDILPVSIVSSADRLNGKELTIKDKSHSFFNIAHKITPSSLTGGISRSYVSHPAMVFPSEIIIEAGDNNALLTVTEFNNGRLVYCGIPALEMFRHIDATAIKFFANLINFSGK